MAVEAVNCSQFFRDESCGKCVPCRLGAQKIVEMGEEILAGGVAADDLADRERLGAELSRAMEMTSICGLGMVAAKPFLSAVQFFGADLRRHVRGEVR
ncbi:MAG: NADH-ubiquinone oxidoreductase-F iron-sulfur binding region domain-containing protein [Planctomycetaceae bacterium]